MRLIPVIEDVSSQVTSGRYKAKVDGMGPDYHR